MKKSNDKPLYSLVSIFYYKPLFLIGFAVGWFQVEYVPEPMRLVFLVGCMVVDLISGLFKSWSQKKATAPEGFQKTVVKITRYCCVILAVWFLANVLGHMSPVKVDYTFFVHGSIGFLSFIEIYSIFDNIYEIDPNSPLSKKLIGPILKFLRGKLEINPIKDIDADKNSN